MTDAISLQLANAGKDDAENTLNEAFMKFETTRYASLERLGHSTRIQEIRRLFCNLIEEMAAPLEESDFPDTFGEVEPADDRSEKLDEDEKYL